MKKRQRTNEGVALISVLILAVFVAVIVGVIASRTVQDNTHTINYVAAIRATEASTAGLELGSDQVFGAFPGGTYLEFSEFLVDSTGLEPGQSFEPSDLDLPIQLGGGAIIESVTVTRSANGQDFLIESTGTSGGVSITAVSGGRVGGEPFQGFGYAVLANNINCIMCHAWFDSVDRVNNTDSDNYGTYDRIKIASLETLLVRVGSADSNLAGTYYTRGVITDKSGNPLSDLEYSDVTGREFDADGKLIEDSSGNMTPHELALAGTDAHTGLYDPNGYLYTDYPETEEEMTDGALPEKFPPVVPDGNGNKVVDGSEFEDLKATLGSGGLSGGIAYGVSPGDSYSDADLPSGSNSAATVLRDTGDYEGNVILTGTPDNPILVDGPIFVDGDVVIKGSIEGTGQIYASGNIYFLGDTTYNDTGGEFGTNDGSNGVSETNLVSYAAGGNIQIGDYLSPKESVEKVWDQKKKKWKSKKKVYDVMSAEALTDATIDSGGPANSGDKASFTMSEVTLFNKIEWEKNQADSDYIPRYYRLRDDAPVFRYDNPGKEHGSKYDEDFVEITDADLAATGAGIVSLAPETAADGDPWLSELFLKKAWQEDELSRDPDGQPFQIDGLLYTNNSIFALARSNKKHNSRTFGQLKVRGAIVAADLGILAAGNSLNLTPAQQSLFGLTLAGKGRGFVMEYDARVNGFLAIEDLGNLQYTRRVRVIVNRG